MNELVESFMRVLGDQPLSLALVAMNLLLLLYCFRTSKQYAKSRRETAKLIVEWQEQSQQIMAHCVSKENLELIINALERDRTLYRQLLQQWQLQPSAKRDDDPMA